jgi:hypothetical protein
MGMKVCCSGCFIPQVRSVSTNWLHQSVDPRTCPDMLQTGKSMLLLATELQLSDINNSDLPSYLEFNITVNYSVYEVAVTGLIFNISLANQ